MAATLEEVRAKFPTAKRAPRENCKYCRGTGERTLRQGFPCICVYVDHAMCDFAAESLAATAKKVLTELKHFEELDKA